MKCSYKKLLARLLHSNFKWNGELCSYEDFDEKEMSLFKELFETVNKNLSENIVSGSLHVDGHAEYKPSSHSKEILKAINKSIEAANE